MLTNPRPDLGIKYGRARGDCSASGDDDTVLNVVCPAPIYRSRLMVIQQQRRSAELRSCWVIQGQSKRLGDLCHCTLLQAFPPGYTIDVQC